MSVLICIHFIILKLSLVWITEFCCVCDPDNHYWIEKESKNMQILLFIRLKLDIIS